MEILNAHDMGEYVEVEIKGTYGSGWNKLVYIDMLEEKFPLLPSRFTDTDWEVVCSIIKAHEETEKTIEFDGTIIEEEDNGESFPDVLGL